MKQDCAILNKSRQITYISNCYASLLPYRLLIGCLSDFLRIAMSIPYRFFTECHINSLAHPVLIFSWSWATSRTAGTYAVPYTACMYNMAIIKCISYIYIYIYILYLFTTFIFCTYMANKYLCSIYIHIYVYAYV